MLIREPVNCVEIYKLELANSQPRMQSVCTLGLPPLRPEAVILDYIFAKEWISSPEHRLRSQFSQRRHLPFRSSRNDTMGLLLGYYNAQGHGDISYYAVLFSITALLTVVQSGVHNVPWEKWGTLNTRIFSYRAVKPTPVGPFWITSFSPLILRDYDPLRAVHVRSAKDDPSSLPCGLPVFAPTKVVSEYWVSGQVETRLPYREFVSRDIDFLNPLEVVGDREWVVVVSATVRWFCTPLLWSSEKSLTSRIDS